MTNFHPTIVSEKFIPTVNFYEDYFGFIVTLEQDGFTLLQKEASPGDRIAIFDKTHQCVEGRVKPVQGLILNIAVDDVKEKYDALYMEGLEIYKEYGLDIHGRKHFVVYDPNGVLINVHEAVEVAPLIIS
jgi:uncharacterized glyoxalase superfamily protein PhnB